MHFCDTSQGKCTAGPRWLPRNVFPVVRPWRQGSFQSISRFWLTPEKCIAKMQCKMRPRSDEQNALPIQFRSMVERGGWPKMEASGEPQHTWMKEVSGWKSSG